jgi:hypothetical protein
MGVLQGAMLVFHQVKHMKAGEWGRSPLWPSRTLRQTGQGQDKGMDWLYTDKRDKRDQGGPQTPVQ